MTANVSVGNTTGLYIGSGAVQVLNSAGQLLAILSNSASIGFNYGNAGNTTVTAQVLGSGVTAGAYGNAAYYPTFTVGTDGRLTAAGAISLSSITGTYGNANVAAYLPTDPNINAIWSNIALTNANLGAFETYANLTFGGSSYGNANVAAYLPTNPNIIAIWGNINTLTANAASQATSINTITANLGAYQTYANTSINTINANLGAFETYANATFGTSNYGNANVAAYLPVFGGNILAGNVFIPYTSGNRNRGPLSVGGNISQYDTGVIASFIGNEPTYLYTSLQNSNSSATAYSSYALNDDTHTYYGELGINSSTYNYATAGYPDNAFSKPLATFLQSTGANLAIGTYGNFGINFLVNGGTVAADAMTIANNGNVTVVGNLTAGGTTTLANVKSTNGYFWANGTAYSTGSAGTYGNANVIALMGNASGPVTGIYTQGINFNTASGWTNSYIQMGNSSDLWIAANSAAAGSGVTFPQNTLKSSTGNASIVLNYNSIVGQVNMPGNVFVGNLITNNGLYWANGVTYASTVTGTYSNANVQSYLPTYTGAIGDYSGVMSIRGSQSIVYGSASNYVSVNGVGSASTIDLVANTTTATGNIVISGLNKGFLTVGNTATVGNLITTAGVYWANGTPYNTGFNGNLSGSTLYDSVNNRIFANAFPLSTPAASWSGNVFTNQIAVKPTYTGTNTLQPPSSGNQIGQIVGQVVSGNIGYQSRYGTQTSSQALMGYLQSWPVTANTMNANDRVRAIQGVNEINLNGTTWGTMNTSSNTATTLVGTSGLSQIVGSGQTATAIGALGAVIVIPVTGSANIQYATNFMATTSYNATNAYTASNIAYARMLGGTLQQTGNLTIQNAVGVHTTTGWATAANKYSVLNEDSSTVIQSAGNIVANTGAYFVGDGTYLVNLPVQTGTYSNANVAAYLASNTDATISNLNANAASQATSINTLFSNAATQQTQINSLATNANANTAAYLTTASITVANIKSTNGYFWANGTPYSSGGGSYANVNVSQYLPHATGYDDGWQIPIGANSARPTFAANGMIRYNTDLQNPEWYNGVTSTWYKFSTAYTPVPPISVDYLIIAGGGGSGASDGGGGGAGGVVSGTTTLTGGTTYTVTVGGGGAGQNSGPGSPGSNSSITGLTTAVGGGYGGDGGTAGGNGGSGGGGGCGGGGAYSGGSGTSGQGNAGGAGYLNTVSDYPAGGGGGAGASGSNAAPFQGGNGGNGVSNSITGSAVTYGGGGGGACFIGGSSGSGGTGGGGAGGNGSSGANGVSGTTYLGGGGGGAGGGSTGGSGGSGSVFISVLTSQYTGTYTGTVSITTSGSRTIIQWLTSGSYTA